MSCFTGFLCLGGTEITNSNRTLAYMRNGLAPPNMTVKDCGCDDLHLALGDDEYRKPELDTAPWADPDRPESYSFAGLLVTEIEGLDSSPHTREVYDRVGDGAVLGRERMGPREITVTGWLFGGDCCGVSYGLKWLAEALRGGCGAECGGSSGEFFTCCPEVCDEVIDGETDGDGAGSGDVANCGDPDDPGYADCVAETCFDPYHRTLHGVALVEGPTVTERWSGGNCNSGCCGGCRAVQVEFTIVAVNPWIYTDPVTVLEETPFDLTVPDECVSPWQESECEDPCETDTCGVDPDCVVPAPPTLPVVSNPCICLPVVDSRVCASIDSDELGDWFESVPIITIYSGDEPMRNVAVRFWQNPVGFDCNDRDRFPDCASCATIAVSYIPANSSLIINGAERTAQYECPGAVRGSALQNLYTVDGGPFGFPVFDCAGVCVCVSVDPETTHEDATVKIELVGRERA